MEIVILSCGAMRCIYSDSFDVAQLGAVSIERASYVEPIANGEWSADLAPVAGPRLGPFKRRDQALAAEIAWLGQHWLCQADAR